MQNKTTSENISGWDDAIHYKGQFEKSFLHGVGVLTFHEDSPLNQLEGNFQENRVTLKNAKLTMKDGSEILIEQQGKNPRKLTPREAGRLQGFPDNFKIPVS